MMVTLVIDDQEIVAQEGTTVLEAAAAAGIYIPTLCYHPDLSTFGGCRVCMVEANGKMVTACRAPVEEGMVVRTDTPAVAAFRQMTVELILASHNPDCQSCARNNHCELQRASAFVGITSERLERLRRSTSSIPTDTSNPFFNLDHTRCILCGICVRTCQEINGVTAIDFTHRGSATRVAPLGGGPLAESRCESCGECMSRCPTGALARKDGEWPAREVKTVCPYCGVGCGIYLGIRGDRIVAVRGDEKSPVNRGQLCVKGRFGYHFVNSPDRLTAPLIRRNGVLVETSWDEALALVADRFTAIKAQYGAGSLAGISSARCTTEENYLFQKLLRLLGTNNIDHCARL
jgi:formate dehydrogenase major subunit